MYALAPIVAAGWYTPVGPTTSAPDATVIWGIVVIVAFLLGYVARPKNPWRIRAYFDDLNDELRDRADLRSAGRGLQLGLNDDHDESAEVIGQRRLPPTS